MHVRIPIFDQKPFHSAWLRLLFISRTCGHLLVFSHLPIPNRIIYYRTFPDNLIQLLFWCLPLPSLSPSFDRRLLLIHPFSCPSLDQLDLFSLLSSASHGHFAPNFILYTHEEDALRPTGCSINSACSSRFVRL